MSESKTPEFKFKVGENEVLMKPNEETIDLAIVIRNKEDVVLQKNEDGIIVGIRIPAFYGVTIALSSLIAYNKYRKKQREKKTSKKQAIDIDELFKDVKTKKKKEEESKEEEESGEEESFISAME
ncbi:MAG: hypothetical protein DRP74_08180 [Candidatus Omnitrophota bacterium]|nr:MAG: hypothetical protein DRP74_08180 [Candidatus Omnitrophota bacterium]